MIKIFHLLDVGAKYTSECNIIALIYLNRITAMSGVPLSIINWRGLWTVSIMLAQKMWDDRPLKTSAFAQILPTVTKYQLRDMEMKALALIQFSTGVKPSLYAKYYFELRSLSTGDSGANVVASREWALKPLSVIQARKLEDRSSRMLCRVKTTPTTSTSTRHQAPITSSSSSSSSTRATGRVIVPSEGATISSTSALVYSEGKAAVQRNRTVVAASPAGEQQHQQQQQLLLRGARQPVPIDPSVSELVASSSSSRYSPAKQYTSKATTSGGRIAADASTCSGSIRSSTAGRPIAATSRGLDDLTLTPLTLEDMTPLCEKSRFVLS